MSKSDRITRKAVGIAVIGFGCVLALKWGGLGVIALMVSLAIGLDCLDDKDKELDMDS